MNETKDKIHILPSSPQEYEYRTKKLYSGVLGRIFGSPENAPANIAGVLLFTLVGSGVIMLVLKKDMTSGEFWEKILPVATLVIGYLFGRKT